MTDKKDKENGKAAGPLPTVAVIIVVSIALVFFVVWIATKSVSGRDPYVITGEPPCVYIVQNAHLAPPETVKYLPGGKFFATYDAAGTIKLWDDPTGERLAEVLAKDGLLGRDVELPDGSSVRVENGEIKQKTDENARAKWSLPMSIRAGFTIGPHGNFTAQAEEGEDGIVRVTVHDKVLGKDKNVFALAEGVRVTALMFSKYAANLAIATNAGEVYVLKSVDYKLDMTLTTDGKEITAAVFNRAGNFFAAGNVEGNIFVWGTGKWRMLKPFQERYGAITSLAWSGDGKRFASGSTGGAAVVWALDGGGVVLALTEHKGEVMSVAFSPDNVHFLSADSERNIYRWSLKE